MAEEAFSAQDVERACMFWAEEDVDQVFNRVFAYLDHLKRVLKKNSATDKELVHALKLLESLDMGPPGCTQGFPVVQVVIGSDGLLPADISHHSPSSSPASSPSPLPNGLFSSVAPSTDTEEPLLPLTSVRLQNQPHTCCKACVPSLPSMLQSTFRGQNPLKVPLLCGFKRIRVMQLRSSGLDGVKAMVSEEEDARDWDIVYKSPCGQGLRNYDDVMHYLLATETYATLQVDFFTFNPSVQLNLVAEPGPRCSEPDLSRGVELTPVELCAGENNDRPAHFRYRRDRWPHGCFLSRDPSLFSTCCDCMGSCTDARTCACIARTRGGRSYIHHRLTEPIPSGLYECGPWCGCDRAHCQNRLVQRGIRVRLQVFQTEDRGWGVRCRDDLDRGTFVCIYAGVILQRLQTSPDPPAPKLMRYDLPSDDEVEVVTEWRAPPVIEGWSKPLETPSPTSQATSPPLHVPVIQRPADTNTTTPAPQTLQPGRPEPSSPSGETCQEDGHPMETMVVHIVNGSEINKHKSLERAADMKDVYFLDASREGNVSRFINHSCRPNLFIQNVFTDTHDPAFPIVAFFTNRVVKAGTELTWNYCAVTKTGSLHQQVCLCGSDGCQGRFAVEDNLYDVCEDTIETC